MSIRVSNLRVGLDDPDAHLPRQIGRAIGLPPDQFRWRILRKSLDTRDKHDIHFVYTAEVIADGAEAAVVERAARRGGPAKVERYREPPFEMPQPGARPLRHRPVVVGSGPAGLTCAVFLAELGYAPLLLERGRIVSRRIRDVKTFDDGGRFEPESNYLFGEGGAGTFSDGKLTCRGSGPDVTRVLELFAECKGKPSILYEHRPHLGSNRLPAVVKALRRRILGHGGEVRFECPVEDLDIRGGSLHGVVTPAGVVPADVVVFAPGHSARDSYQMLVKRGVPLVRKPFQFGVRVEHPQALVNRAQYGDPTLAAKLGNADYSLVARGRYDVFTFCMCAGGYVIPSVSAEGYFCTNGMSLSKRDGDFANSGLVVTVPTAAFDGEDVLAGVRLQERYERIAYELGGGEYRCPVQRAADFLAGRRSTAMPTSSYPRGTVNASLDDVVPPLVAEALRHGLPQMDRRWRGKFLPEAVLAGPEARGSAPVRMPREDESRQSPGLEGFYPVGEGAGYAGGIVSAAVDGLRTARAIVARYARP